MKIFSRLRGFLRRTIPFFRKKNKNKHFVGFDNSDEQIEIDSHVLSERCIQLDNAHEAEDGFNERVAVADVSDSVASGERSGLENNYTRSNDKFTDLDNMRTDLKINSEPVAKTSDIKSVVTVHADDLKETQDLTYHPKENFDELVHSENLMDFDSHVTQNGNEPITEVMLISEPPNETGDLIHHAQDAEGSFYEVTGARDPLDGVTSNENNGVKLTQNSLELLDLQTCKSWAGVETDIIPLIKTPNEKHSVYSNQSNEIRYLTYQTNDNFDKITSPNDQFEVNFDANVIEGSDKSSVKVVLNSVSSKENEDLVHQSIRKLHGPFNQENNFDFVADTHVSRNNNETYTKVMLNSEPRKEIVDLIPHALRSIHEAEGSLSEMVGLEDVLDCETSNENNYVKYTSLTQNSYELLDRQSLKISADVETNIGSVVEISDKKCLVDLNQFKEIGYLTYQSNGNFDKIIPPKNEVEVDLHTDDRHVSDMSSVKIPLNSVSSKEQDLVPQSLKKPDALFNPENNFDFIGDNHFAQNSNETNTEVMLNSDPLKEIEDLMHHALRNFQETEGSFYDMAGIENNLDCVTSNENRGLEYHLTKNSNELLGSQMLNLCADVETDIVPVIKTAVIKSSVDLNQSKEINYLSQQPTDNFDNIMSPKNQTEDYFNTNVRQSTDNPRLKVTLNYVSLEENEDLIHQSIKEHEKPFKPGCNFDFVADFETVFGSIIEKSEDAWCPVLSKEIGCLEHERTHINGDLVSGINSELGADFEAVFDSKPESFKKSCEDAFEPFSEK